MILDQDKTTQEYIEVIFELELENRVARVKDIADRRGVSKSTVSLILRQLLEKQLIVHEQYSHVSLSDKGRTLAQILDKRHETLKNFMISNLKMSEENAERDACKLEHEISLEMLDAIEAKLNE